MNNTLHFFITNKKATTLMEIMLAVVILAFTFIPIIVTIGTSTKDTDVANSYVYAQTTARNILDTLLDDVPFNSIKGSEGKYSIAELKTSKNALGNDYDIKIFNDMFGVGTSGEAKGTLTDERGTKYEVIMYVYPIPASNTEEGKKDKELLFHYLPRPKYETASASGISYWFNYPSETMTKYKAAFLRNGCVDPISGASTDLPNAYYPYSGDTKGSYIDTPVIRNSYGLGTVPDSDGNYYIMKKIILTITWTGRDKKERRLALYTVKANLDSDGKAVSGS